MSRISDERASGDEGTVTLEGTAWKGLFLLTILILAGYWAFAQTFPAAEVATSINSKGETVRSITSIGPLGGLLGIGALVGFGIGMLTIFVPRISPVTSILYAGAEGLVLGVLSGAYEKAFPGIVLTAALSSLGVMAVMLVLYALRILKYTPGFAAGLSIALLGVLVAYLGDMAIRVFGGPGIPGINDASPFGILVSVVICGIAALCFVGDFASIEDAKDSGAPKYMEWYGAFSMLVTLIWLYLEILRLLAKARSKD